VSKEPLFLAIFFKASLAAFRTDFVSFESNPINVAQAPFFTKSIFAEARASSPQSKNQ